MKTRKIKIKDTNRFKIFLVAVCFLAIIFFQDKMLYSYNYPNIKYISVQNGESLWEIAQKYKADDDVRDFIERIKDVNELSTSDLAEGQIIKVPSYES